MRFLVDAQLPARLVRLLNEWGHDSTHTSELPKANRTADDEISMTADVEDRVVVSKDWDFRNSHLLHGSPRQLLMVRTGNISNDDLLALFVTNLDQIIKAFDGASLVELRRDSLAVHSRKPD